MPLLLLLFELGFEWRFDIVGEISASEIFLLALSPVILYRIHPFHNRQIAQLLWIYLLLMITQIVTEYTLENEIENSARGVAVTVVSLLQVGFMYLCLKKDRTRLAWIGLGMAIRYLLFKQDIVEGGVDTDDYESVMFKFQYAPMLFGCIIFLGTYWRNRLFYLLLILAGGVFLLLGARSFGGIVVASGLVMMMLTRQKQLRMRYFRLYAFVILGVIYGGYCLYVNQVVSGNISAGNSKQIVNLDDPYNPVNLLMMGRTEAWVGYMAFSEKPLTGWGAWATDPDNRFTYLQQELKGEDFREIDTEQVIPAHSVIIGYGMQNGLFAMLLVIILFVWILRKGIYLIRNSDKYAGVITFLTIQFSWEMLFSPVSSLRMDLPICMAFILVSWQIMNDQRHLTHRTEEHKDVGNPIGNAEMPSV